MDVEATPASARSLLKNPEFIAHALRLCYKPSSTTTAYIAPGSPWENGFAESLQRTIPG